MDDLQEITVISLRDQERAPVGRPGSLRDIPISDLRIDGSYQRRISSSSVKVVRKICDEFDWAKFLPVIVVEKNGFFCIIDGQHRTTAAASIGITEVPCYILDCNHQEAASAFAAINGNVTPVSPQDVWFAQIQAGDPDAMALQRVMDSADVRIVRTKDAIKVGETRSIAVLKRARSFYGDALLTTILQAIVQTGDGNPGMILGAVINGLGKAIMKKPELFTEPTLLFDMMDKVSIADMMDHARIETARTGNPLQYILTREFNRIISEISPSQKG